MENMRANAESADKQASACETIANMAFASEYRSGRLSIVNDKLTLTLPRTPCRCDGACVAT